MAHRRDLTDLRNEVSIQLHLLHKSCREFDEGDLHEIRNIARALRVLIAKDGHGNASLIELADYGLADFIDTRMLAHTLSLVPYFGLAVMVFGSQTIGCRAPLSDGPEGRRTSFKDWLEQSVLDDKEGESFSRLRLVKAIANLGGGTHYPPDVREYFVKMQSFSVSAVNKGRNVEQSYADVEKHSLRQIAHEVLVSFDTNYRKEAHFEAGAIMLGPSELICYPGRKLKMSSVGDVKKASSVIPQATPHSFEGIAGPLAKLPYDRASPSAPCPCHSGLLFESCCSKAREFDTNFIDMFERRHSLGKYRID